MSDFTAKIYQIRFRLKLCPRTRWRVYRVPRTASWIQEDILLRTKNGGKGEEKGAKGRGPLLFIANVCPCAQHPSTVRT